MSAVDTHPGHSWDRDTRACPTVDFDPPEEVVVHLTYPDPAEGLAWGVMPGTALCGFIFTTANELGDPSATAHDPRFIQQDCAPCHAVLRSHELQAATWIKAQR